MLGSSTTTGTMPRVNLLPPEIAEKAALRRSQVAMVGTGLAAVAVVGALYVNQTHKVAEAQQEKAAVAATHTKLTKDLADLKSVSDTYAAVDAAKTTLASAMQYEVLWSSYLHDMTLTIPENVWLTSFSATVDTAPQPATAKASTTNTVLDPGLGTVTIAGKALAKDDVAAWLESVAKQRGYSNPYFTQLNQAAIGERPVYEFTSTVNLTPKALSTRYSKGLAR
jgi:Tfp pilus assembly protein PilN